MSVGDWEVVGEDQLAYDGFLRVLVRRYRMPDGTVADWHLLDTPPSVTVLALTTDERVVLVEQYRPGPGKVVRSLPGGIIDAGEEPVEAAARELLEETGWAAGSVELVGTVEPLNATSSWYVTIARDCTLAGAQSLDELEDIAVVLTDLAGVRASLRDGSMGSLAQTYLALDHLGLLGG